MSNNSNNTNAISKPEGQNPEDTNASKTSESDSSTSLNGVDYKLTIDELLKALFGHLTNDPSKFRQTWATFEAKWRKVELDNDFCTAPTPNTLIQYLSSTKKDNWKFDHFEMFAQMLAYNPFSAILDRYINAAGYNGQDHSKIREIIAENWSTPETLPTSLKPFLNIGVIVDLYSKLYRYTLFWDDVQKKIAELKQNEQSNSPVLEQPVLSHQSIEYVKKPLESQQSPTTSKSDSDVPPFPFLSEFTSEANVRHSLSFGFDWLYYKICQIPDLTDVKLAFEPHAPSISGKNRFDVLFYHVVDLKMIPLIAGEFKAADKWVDALPQLKFTTLMPSYSFGELQFFLTVGGSRASIIFNDPIRDVHIYKTFVIDNQIGYSEFFVTLFNLVKSFAKAPPPMTKVKQSDSSIWSSITYAIPELYVAKTFFSDDLAIVRSRYHHLSQLFGKIQQFDIFHGNTIPDNSQTRKQISEELQLKSNGIFLNKCVGASRISPIFERPESFSSKSVDTYNSSQSMSISQRSTPSRPSNHNSSRNTPPDKKLCGAFLIITPFIPDIPANFKRPNSTFQFIKTLHKHGITHNDLRRSNIINGYVIDYEYATIKKQLKPSDMMLIRELNAWIAFSKQFSSIVTFPDCSFILLCFYDLYTLCNSLCDNTEEFDLFIQEFITSSTSFSQQELDNAYEKAETFFF